MKNVISIVFCAFVFCFVSSLAIFSNKEQNKISEREKRQLANPPTAKFMSEAYKTQLSDWLGDNVFKRDAFINLRSIINETIFHIKPISNEVEYGKNNWLFYKLDNNIEIAKGTYPLNLEKIAKNQQAISDYYKSIGKEYILLIHPSKVSLYPECLYGDYKITESPCDLIYKYLIERTDVNVIDLKSALLQHKKNGLLSWPGDTHYTPLGLYYTYIAIMDFFIKNGYKGNLVNVAFSNEIRNIGDLRLMLGKDSPIDKAKSFEFIQTSKELTSGKYYEKLKKAFINSYGEDGINYKFAIYENSKGNDKLLMLADSQFQPQQRRIPLLLSESFNRVEYIWNYFSTQEIDETSDANIVLCAISERASCLLEIDPPAYMTNAKER